MRTGRVTSALFRMREGNTVGLRGPYGNSFPIEDCFGKNLLFVAGGIALPPLRTLIWNCLDWRDRFGDITIVYGARTVEDLVYKRELDEWAAQYDVATAQRVLRSIRDTAWRLERNANRRLALEVLMLDLPGVQ